MGVFQIIFIALTVAVPSWLYTRTDHDKRSEIDWTTLEKNLARLIESDEGFPDCSTLEVVDVIHNLCDHSRRNFHEGNPMPVEQASKQVVFSCFVQKDLIQVGWHLEENPDSQLACREPGGEVIRLAPEFIFNNKGRMSSIEFSNGEKTRESVPYRNCRVKASVAKAMDISSTQELGAFLQALGQTPGDPFDYASANLICLTFDSSPLWNPWREKYFK